ncbi:alcohol dehydrogenase catalytic domain-containing protein [Pararhodospirillum photometricum]|uniref:Zinc-containing alcohol dehydrogenase superfamily n=1 Tax=Pararhodospirillum photometricum DSM 122 TaxID=1150469 RepID=H6SR35_PARPM|nr:alcohol dehydrogenase catalytic domain-containing protein [Pararhodospirillum photometricum]CCG09757.1 Zinc-containing alcohol dehydrogenase superfamily [Pararhodospirillum photometricum DSM 122]
MKALVFSRPGSLSIEELPCPEPHGDELLIKVAASGICGTDVHIFHGGFPCAFPLVPGHEFAGEVVAVGPECVRFQPGARVAVEPNIPCNNCPECLRGEHHYCRAMRVPGVNLPGGMAEYVLVNERAAFDIGALPWEHGALVEPLSCVVHATERLAPQLGEQVLVMGAGPIGVLMARLMRARGVRAVDILEREPERRRAAAALGLGRVFGDPVEISAKTYDACADATGASVLVAEAANRLVRPGAGVGVWGAGADGDDRSRSFPLLSRRNPAPGQLHLAQEQPAGH